MIVVAILGILAAIAIPSYTNYVIKGNRSAAQSFLMIVAQKQEQYLVDARQYATFDAGTGPTALGLTVPTDVSSFYQVSTANRIDGDTRTYVITATPIAHTQQENDGALTLNDLGQKSSNWR